MLMWVLLGLWFLLDMMLYVCFSMVIIYIWICVIYMIDVIFILLVWFDYVYIIFVKFDLYNFRFFCFMFEVLVFWIFWIGNLCWIDDKEGIRIVVLNKLCSLISFYCVWYK